MFPVLFAREAPLGRNEKVAALPTMDQPPLVWVTTRATHRGKKRHASLLGLPEVPRAPAAQGGDSMAWDGAWSPKATLLRHHHQQS